MPYIHDDNSKIRRFVCDLCGNPTMKIDDGRVKEKLLRLECESCGYKNTVGVPYVAENSDGTASIIGEMTGMGQ